MMIASTDGGRGIRATPNTRASCPECGQRVIAKCGPILTWHWAHWSLGDCSNQGETEWHREWKAWAYENGCQIEHKIVEGFRADVVTPNGRVVELQSKALPVETTRERESAYLGRLTWLIKVEEDRIVFGKHLNNGGRGFRWKNGPKRLSFCKAPLVLHLIREDGVGVELFAIAKMALREGFYSDAERLIGWGRFVDAESLFEIRRQHRFCAKHHSFFCPCVASHLYTEREAALWP